MWGPRAPTKNEMFSFDWHSWKNSEFPGLQAQWYIKEYLRTSLKRALGIAMSNDMPRGDDITNPTPSTHGKLHWKALATQPVRYWPRRRLFFRQIWWQLMGGPSGTAHPINKTTYLLYESRFQNDGKAVWKMLVKQLSFSWRWRCGLRKTKKVTNSTEKRWIWFWPSFWASFRVILITKPSKKVGTYMYIQYMYTNTHTHITFLIIHVSKFSMEIGHRPACSHEWCRKPMTTAATEVHSTGTQVLVNNPW